MFLTGNPAASLVMKRDLQSITLEQASHGVTKTQATPLMFNKLAHISSAVSLPNHTFTGQA